MIKINLLPEDIQRRAEQPAVIVYLIPPLIALFFSGFLFLRVSKQIKTVEAEVKNIEAELAKYKDIQAALRRVQDELDRTKARIAFISAAREKQSFWLEVLTNFAAMLPPNMVLGSLTVGPSGEITLSGETDRFTTVANFLRLLNASPMFLGASLSSVSKGYGAGGEETGLTTFGMKVNYVPKKEREKVGLEKKG